MRARRMVALGALVLVAAAGCKSHDQPGVATVNGAGATPAASASAAADRAEQLRKFAQCMRDHGVAMADPDPNGGFGAGIPAGINPTDPAVQSAFTACQALLPNGGTPPKLDPQQAQKYEAFAQCMRDNGVDLPDPGPDGSLQIGPGGAGAILADPDFQKALTACRDTLTALRSSAPTR